MGKASSTKKIARMAQKGRGKKVRFQGGSVFPVAVLSVTILGLLLVWYARNSSPAEAAGPRASNGDHWHLAYGFYTCATGDRAAGYLDPLVGNIETTSKYLATGVHSHDDGVIHWHPTSAKASGANAKLGVFLDNYDIQLSDDELKFPDTQEGGATFEEGTTKCTDDNGKEVDGVLKAFVWPKATDTADFRVLTAGLNDIRVTENGMAITVAFVPADVDSVPPPPTAAQLEELGAADTEPSATSVPAGSDTTVSGSTDTTVAGSTDSTVAGPTDTTVAGSADTTIAAPTTASAPDTAPPTTGA